jgi:hypothetical protein
VADRSRSGTFANAGPGRGSLLNYRVVFIPDWLSTVRAFAFAFYDALVAGIQRDEACGSTARRLEGSRIGGVAWWVPDRAASLDLLVRDPHAVKRP